MCIDPSASELSGIAPPHLLKKLNYQKKKKKDCALNNSFNLSTFVGPVDCLFLHVGKIWGYKFIELRIVVLVENGKES